MAAVSDPTPLSDELLKRIAESPHRCYGHEGRSMAAELIKWREKAKAAAQQNSTGMGSVGQPYPFHP